MGDIAKAEPFVKFGAIFPEENDGPTVGSDIIYKETTGVYQKVFHAFPAATSHPDCELVAVVPVLGSVL